MERDECVILVVEDDEDIRRAVVDALRERNHTVLEATNGIEALHMLQSFDVTLVLLDLMMPVMTGWELLDKMREDSRLALIPVCVTSAFAGRQALRVKRVLQKPYALDAMLEVVNELC